MVFQRFLKRASLVISALRQLDPNLLQGFDGLARQVIDLLR